MIYQPGKEPPPPEEDNNEDILEGNFGFAEGVIIIGIDPAVIEELAALLEDEHKNLISRWHQLFQQSNRLN